MKGNKLLYLLSAFSVVVLTSFVSVDGQSFQQRFIRYFQKLGEASQEKLYLHLDKPFYSAGERIWFKGYLVNATFLKDSEMSNYIYLELLNRNDSVLMRKKYMRDSCGFSGHLLLPSDIQSDQYYLRAYTNWMRNVDSSFFYLRNLEINNPIANQIVSSVKYFHDDETTIAAVMAFSDNLEKPYADMKVRVQLKEGDKIRKTDVLRTNQQGEARFKFSSNSVSEMENPRIEVEFVDDVYVYRRAFFLPPLGDDYNITFFPEGGNLLDGQDQVVAFKAQHESGFSESVTGCVVNQHGDTVAPMISQHDGMGVFTFRPKTGEQYFALSVSSKDIHKKFALPAVQAQGMNLSLSVVKNILVYKVLTTDATVWPDSLFVVAHTRGQLKYLYPVGKESATGTIPVSVFDDGITHFMLVGPEGNPISERLYFFLKPRAEQWSVQANCKHVAREPVSLQITLADSSVTDLTGRFSVSITDKNQVKQDRAADNILSNLLLTSDLKGYIDRPGYYFEQQDRARTHYLNLVMLTHGWTRHPFKQMAEEPVFQISHFIEKGQYISGLVRSALNKPREGQPVSIMAPQIFYTASETTDENGRFTFHPPGFCDSVVFFLDVKKKSAVDNVEVLVERDSFPLGLNKNFYKPVFSRVSDEYLKNSREAYFNAGGEPVFNLKEVSVTADRKQMRQSVFSGGAADYVKKAEDLKRPGVTTVMDALRHMGSLTVTFDDRILLRGDKEPLVLVNDLPTNKDNSYLRQISIDELSEIRILRGAESVIVGGQGSENGVVIITLTSDFKRAPKAHPSMAQLVKLGVSQAEEFYHPVYDAPEKKREEKRDFRSTVYWNPNVLTNEKGEASLRFYATDAPDNYSIVIEGTAQNGKIYRYEGDLK